VITEITSNIHVLTFRFVNNKFIYTRPIKILKFFAILKQKITLKEISKLAVLLVGIITVLANIIQIIDFITKAWSYLIGLFH
jgi:hypothetical protein